MVLSDTTAIPSNGSDPTRLPEFLRGEVSFGTPTTPNPAAKTLPLGYDMAKPDFELQVLDRLSKIQKQQTTDAETLLAVIDARTSRLTSRIAALEKNVGSLAVGIPIGIPAPGIEGFSEMGMTPPVADTPPAPAEEPVAMDSTLFGFDIENFVRINLFKRLHYDFKAAGARGKTEFIKGDLRWAPRDGFKDVDSGEALSVIEDYITVFLKKRKFDCRSFKHKYPKVNFKAMGNFFSNVSRSINKLINTGIA